MWRPGNPTYATPEPSVRYSPYSLGLAMLARVSGADSYDLMCAAAVINTVLLVAGLYALLRVYRQQAAAAVVLVVVVALWGGAPGYANSLALADLPVQQMNPSAFALGLVLLLWTLVRGGERGRGAPLLWPVLAIIGAVALLTHPMTGVFGFGGLLLLALVAPADRRGPVAGVRRDHSHRGGPLPGLAVVRFPGCRPQLEGPRILVQPLHPAKDALAVVRGPYC